MVTLEENLNEQRPCIELLADKYLLDEKPFELAHKLSVAATKYGFDYETTYYRLVDLSLDYFNTKMSKKEALVASGCQLITDIYFKVNNINIKGE